MVERERSGGTDFKDRNGGGMVRPFDSPAAAENFIVHKTVIYPRQRLELNAEQRLNLSLLIAAI